ncbi:DUF4426 domain-containing protein [Microbulbifer thermotolerans]|uniref:DUF4426 domain-containing protein n=1 Tax=Microbulbifer thermotolerans TaxID=252514 RepID=A0A143HIL1_MICTH|nr:DUF4426 domain-containing protein [Microbulbifer thermotolerans]AMX01331.1 hypothetical protein A3224_00925 [Microbulbifer thermotolerans]MCX2780271.1 DUF4426 domain-containing protein [Microbulbifer thermotolerans]MCX2782734.1 DUF4426 domain-containing protein [Microbulbifer thermotolerans]MCX2795612.1 DUF4426 domain-containing protein [Microbulbifer thermotolerans]MCX2800202.1 DUF4426 domain-containing protein [Microbulbifer thermotolerans]
MKQILAAASLLLMWAAGAAAQEAKVIKSHEDFGDYRVIFTVFNSEFIKPAIAQNYQLVRAKDRAFVNVSVVEKVGGKRGLSTELSGTATNLIQQSRQLKFLEIREGDAVYYLAPLRFEDEETLTFDIKVKLPNGRTETITFRRKLEKD